MSRSLLEFESVGLRSCGGLRWSGRGLVDASVAQLAEHLICNQAVVGSSPTAGSIGRRAQGRQRDTGPGSARRPGVIDPLARAGLFLTTRHLTDDTGAACGLSARVAGAPELRSDRSSRRAGRFQSGQMDQAVNLVVSPSAVRIRLSPPKHEPELAPEHERELAPARPLDARPGLVVLAVHPATWRCSAPRAAPALFRSPGEGIGGRHSAGVVQW